MAQNQSNIWRAVLWFLASFAAMVYLQQQVVNSLARLWRHFFSQPMVLLWLNQIVFLPGVWLHETSHWLLAKLLGVPTFAFSLWPHPLPDGTIRMGYVSVAQTDALRAALIGAAPLLGGALAVWAIGYWRFRLPLVGQALLAGQWQRAAQLAALWRWDVLLWLYLLFAFSNTMLPSAADQQAWPVVILVLVLLVGGVCLLGWGRAAWQLLGDGLMQLMLLFASTFSVTTVINLVALAVIWALLWLLRA